MQRGFFVLRLPLKLFYHPSFCQIHRRDEAQAVGKMMDGRMIGNYLMRHGHAVHSAATEGRDLAACTKIQDLGRIQLP
jgi:hypothetical protein